MTTEFRELTTPESLQTVRDIADDIWPKTYAPILAPEQIAYMMDMMYAPAVMERELAEGTRFEALYVDGSPAGFISFSDSHDVPGEAKLHKLYLLGEFHGKGIGSLMLRHAAERCAALGYRSLRLNVNKYNDRALRAYERNGFVRADSVRNDIGNGFVMDDYVMRKALDALPRS